LAISRSKNVTACAQPFQAAGTIWNGTQTPRGIYARSSFRRIEK
jgi:hypothetical protein